jgi:hypothetical protein
MKFASAKAKIRRRSMLENNQWRSLSLLIISHQWVGRQKYAEDRSIGLIK